MTVPLVAQQPRPARVELATARLVLRPVTDDDSATLRAIRRSAEVGRWCHPPVPGWPTEAYPASVTRLAVELSGARSIGPDGAVIGLVEIAEGDDPERATASVEVVLAGSVHRRGLGREALAAVIRWLVEVRGHHRVTAAPAVGNTAAIACYRACGFVPAGVLHRYERDTDGDGWHDNLLLEHLTT